MHENIVPPLPVAVLCLCLAAPMQAEAQWQYHEKSDPITDSVSSLAMVQADDGARLSVQCIGGNELAVRVIFPGFMPFMGETLRALEAFETLRVMIRFDNGEVRESRWRLIARGLNSVAVFDDLAMIYARHIFESERVAVRINKSDGGDVTAVFDFDSSSGSVGRVLDMCGT